MIDDTSQKVSFKQRAIHEFEDMGVIFLYLAFFFCAISTYSMLLLNKFEISYFTYGAALINALVIAKVILIGEYARIGRKHEAKPLLYSAIYKAFVFGLLVFAFHLIEEAIKEVVHGHRVAAAFREMRIDDLLARTVIVFCTFIPLFAFRELQRVLGEDKFRTLLFRTNDGPKPDLSCRS
jgi:hypothetical protein